MSKKNSLAKRRAYHQHLIKEEQAREAKRSAKKERSVERQKREDREVMKRQAGTHKKPKVKPVVAKQAKETLQAETLDVVADRGYYNGDEIRACEQAGIDAYRLALVTE